jgi:acetoin utilization deacetylase AcuC-like enzyme
MPLYPGSGARDERGEGAGEGFTINCPLRAGDGGREVIRQLERHLIPAADAFAPEAVLVSAGFDGRAGDPLGGLRLSDDDFSQLTVLVARIAERHAAGRLVSCLEGGYDPRGLALASAAHVQALMGP